MKKYTVAFGVLCLIIIAYYGISPIFRTAHLDEAAPAPGGTKATVLGTVGHPAEGTAHIVRDGDRVYVRYEKFKTLNGPDLFVYLATDESAREFINLGRLKATEGNINYEIPAGTDLSKYHYVLTWCRAFSVLFNSAKLE